MLQIFKVRERALVQAKELYGDSGDPKDLASHVTKEVEAIMAKKGNALFELMLTAAAGDEEAVKVTLNSTSTSNAVGVVSQCYSNFCPEACSSADPIPCLLRALSERRRL